MWAVLTWCLLSVGLGVYANTQRSSKTVYDTGYVADWSADWALVSGRIHQPKCIDIPANLTLCRGIGYTQMRLPNLLEHDTIGEVTSQAKSWVPLTNVRCHDHAKLFLCSLFSPVCVDRPIWPCRSLCENVKRGCESRMKTYGFPWPEMLRCDKFPKDNDLCIQPPTGKPVVDNTCEPCKQPDTVEGIVDSFCRAEFVLRMKVKDSIVVGSDSKVTPMKRKRLLKRGTLKKHHLKSLTLYVPNGKKCDCDLMDNKKDHLLVMGKTDGKRFVITFMRKFDRKNKNMRKAVKLGRKGNVCKGGVSVFSIVNKSKVSKSGRKKKRDRKSKTPKRNRKSRRGRKRSKGKAKAGITTTAQTL